MTIFWRAVLVMLIAFIGGLSPILVPISAVGAAGQVLVADPGSGSIRLYSADGASLDMFASSLSMPSWITVDAAGNVYVSEHDGLRISKFSPTGTNLLTISTTISTATSTITYNPGGVQVGADGTIYVADYFGGNVHRYSASGDYLGLFASGALARADFMAFDATGNLYVTDFILGVVRRFAPNGEDLGNFVSEFPDPRASRSTLMAICTSPASRRTSSRNTRQRERTKVPSHHSMI